MSGEELREALAAATAGLPIRADRCGAVDIQGAESLAAALLPVVLRYGQETAAAELRAAADEIAGDGRGGFEAALRSIYCTRLLRDRADALTVDPT